MELRVLVDRARGGHENMALDEALLALDGAWLRFYTWDEPTLSLGWFQDEARFEALSAEIPRVRRPTGGGAILHADELTFALGVPASLLPPRVRESYTIVNTAVARACASHGVLLSEPEAPTRGRSDWCFERATGLDLVDARGRKVFGSAQRRSGTRVLQHGSLVVESDEICPFSGSLREAGFEAEPGELVDRLAAELATALALREVRVDRLPAVTNARAESPLATRR